MQDIKCGEIWGGIKGENLEVVTCGVRASLYSSAARGDRGGDIYYFSVCGSDVLTRVAIADVAGHGEPVTRTSQWLYDSLQSRMNSVDGHEVLADLNHLAVEYGYQAMTTAALVAFYRTDGQLSFSYAGHHPVMVRAAGSSEWTGLALPNKRAMANLPLGVDDSVTYDQSQVPLSRGSQFVLYTDGLLEARDPEGRFFGHAGLQVALDSLGDTDATTLKEGIMDRVLTRTGRPLDHDDVTLLVVEVK